MIDKKHHPPSEAQRLMQGVFKVPNHTRTRGLQSPKPPRTTVHARKSHRKSRTGCKTCKQRRIKCDENRPGGCLKCQSHGLECDYLDRKLPNPGRMVLPNNGQERPTAIAAETADLSTLARITCISSLSRLNITPLPPIPRMVGQPDQMTPILQTLHHFDTVTYCSMGSHLAQQVIKTCMHNLVVQNPSLLHAINGVSAAHLCHLLPADQHPKQYRQNQLAAAYHWKEAVRLFRNDLESGAVDHSMDALISTMMLVSVHQYMLNDPKPHAFKSFVDVPLERRRECLQWLNMGKGFQAVSQCLGDLMRQSIWVPVMQDADYIVLPFWDHLQQDETCTLFLELCEITEQSSPEGNTFYAPLEHLLFYRHLKPCANNFAKFITFVGQLDDQFQRLLLQLDKRALLILAYWLAMMTKIQQWWIGQRSSRECRSIVRYLMHDEDRRVRKLLEYPAAVVNIAL